MKNILKIHNITLQRSASFSLHLDKLRLEAGTILCVAGPNGSGKSTLVECLAGLLSGPDIDITICGRPLRNNLLETKAAIGYIPDDESWLIKELCAQEYFNLIINTYRDLGTSEDKMRYRQQYLAKVLRFEAFLQPLESLSHGNKKKVQIIAGLLHEPSIVIVDELRNGLDPLAIIAAESIIRSEASRGAVVVAATHDLWWAERIADEVLLLLDGSVALHQATDDLLEKYGSIENLFVQIIEREHENHAAV
jgi:ABC-2 type transport system ATP-binding protein